MATPRSGEPKVTMPEVYAAVAARRTQFDNLLWQVPVLTITAQAFLFTIALGADTQPVARIISCVLSLLITFLSSRRSHVWSGSGRGPSASRCSVSSRS